MPKAMAQAIPNSLDLMEVEIAAQKMGLDQVRVLISAVALNLADPRVLRGKGAARFLHANVKPLVVGYDFAGRIIESNSNEFDIDTMIFGHLPYGTKTRQGTLGEEIVVNTNEVARCPQGVSVLQAVAASTSGIAALQALQQKGKLKAGQSVLIIGASGGVGCAAVGIAKKLGGIVTAVCSTYAIETVRQMGADVVLDRTQKDFRKLPRRFDIVFDASGTYAYGECRMLLSDNGVFVTAAPGLSVLFAKIIALFYNQRVEMVMAQPKRSDLEKIAGWMAQGLRIPIALHLPLAQASDALEALEKGKLVGKIVLEVRAD